MLDRPILTLAGEGETYSVATATSQIRPSHAAVGNGQSAWSSILTKRQQILLHTQPLILMQHYQGSRDEEYEHYDTLCLAIKVFDLIIDQSGFGSEVVRDTVAEGLSPLLRAFDDQSGAPVDLDRHGRFVDQLLSALKNEKNRGQAFEVDYHDFDEKGRPHKRNLSFKLVKESHGYTGHVVLKLSSEAINLFLNAFDPLDIESAQAANEAVVQLQLARGKYNEAIRSAQNARGQSMRYEEEILRLIEQTKRDIERVDWRGEAHQILVDALAHVDLRLQVEDNIIQSAEEKLDLLDDDDDQRSAVAEILCLMKDCRSRHLRLNTRLMAARTEFLEQQARQSFVESPHLEPVDLLDGVLRPMLSQSAEAVRNVTDSSLHSLAGPGPPPVLSLGKLVAWQLQPRRLQLLGETAVVEQEFAETDAESRRFDEATMNDMHAVLLEITTPTRLSALLENLSTDRCPPKACDAVVLRLLRQFDRDQDDDLQFGVVLAERGGLCTDQHYGDDLWVIPQNDGYGDESE